MPARRHDRSASIRELVELDAFEPSVLDAGWLRTLLRHAVRCSLASSLALGACADSAAPSTQSNPDPGVAGAGGTPGVWHPVAADCKTDQGWHLASGFHLGRSVDYVAERWSANLEGLISEAGAACATAQDLERCESALALQTAGVSGYHLVTTEGDEVRLWTAPSARALFGDIDTTAEAISLLLLNSYSVGCDAAIGKTGRLFSIAANRMPSCGTEVKTTVLVSSDGTMEETAVQMTHNGCTEGRRPEGLRSAYRSGTSARLGEHFAAMAHMEAASVPAFAAIASELRSYAAPAALVRGAQRALRDEVRHARATAWLAQRFGVRAVAPVVERMPLRALEAFALDNAVEGCVNETYAAAEARHRAACAGDPLIRRELRSIAADETRHAELSWAIARWVMPELGRAAHARIRAAQSAAVAALGEQLRAEVDPELCARAGVPDAHAACALHASLARTLWRA